ncbi:copper-translocating P-type ATPase [Rhinocladiella mackenziei CBS 650.93]|uniref:Copper-translocating P-type ATPase n=1 Tax=Rhinocladiella mackenziei CBS 650.93 TaxID=1442369 RepID=A0A0D2J406_9EURO|nr:copper-translocating P-type ATPase [Rhinocladiella mackenziei CBS 650.93]KIX03730.1 copper-translocating P-type ATPase [Rhinocladiella mackenziei CBS 650.93]
MTCVGCELKISRCLVTAFPRIQNLQISVILARVAFDLDTGQATVDQVIDYLGRATEFTYERIVKKGHEIDVIHPKGTKALVRQVKPLGVTGMKALTDEIARIEYDPVVRGAREVLNKSFDVPLQLAPMKPPESIEAGSKEVRKDGMMTLFSSLLTIPVLVLAWAPLPHHPVIYGSVSLALATIIQIVVAGPFYPVAFKNLVFSRLIEVDLLIVLSTSTAYLFSVIAFAYQVKGEPLSTGDFFEASTLIVSLIMLGRFISSWARQRAAESISFRTLQASTALLVDGESKTDLEIDARLLQYGDIFKVSPESRIVTDGTVVSGISEVDESMVTGESRPVFKETGSAVIAGSMNGSGLLHIRPSRLPGDNTISAIADMVDEAKMTKARTQEIADRVAGYFVPVIVCITIITFAGWTGYGIERRGYLGSEAAENAVTYAIAVLIVSCPCAIGLCVPMVIVIAGGVAAKHGVIFKTGQTIEVAKKTNHVVFDKTGTLTEGVLSVVAESFPGGQEDSIKPIILGLIADIKHPVSIAVSQSLKDRGIIPAPVDEVTTIVGKGVQGLSEGKKISAGNCRWLGMGNHVTVQDFLSRGLTVFCVVMDTQLDAVFGLEDSVRPDSYSVISELQRRGISVSIVSGDDDGAVQKLASTLSIPPSQVRSRCLPKDKLEFLQEIMTDKRSVVIFCGDGTNDAPALAQANIGIHVNEGSEIAQSAADAVLVRPFLSGILCLIDLSHAAVKRIIFNFCWSFTYNLFAVLLAAGLFVKWRIPPEYAALGEVVSILPVIGMALLLRYIKLESCDSHR